MDYRNKPRIARHSDSPIARARMARGWTQGQLAEAIGSTQSQVAGWESGRRKPKLDALMGIASALGIELTELIAQK